MVGQRQLAITSAATAALCVMCLAAITIHSMVRQSQHIELDGCPSACGKAAKRSSSSPSWHCGGCKGAMPAYPLPYGTFQDPTKWNGDSALNGGNKEWAEEDSAMHAYNMNNWRNKIIETELERQKQMYDLMNVNSGHPVVYASHPHPLPPVRAAPAPRPAPARPAPAPRPAPAARPAPAPRPAPAARPAAPSRAQSSVKSGDGIDYSNPNWVFMEKGGCGGGCDSEKSPVQSLRTRQSEEDRDDMYAERAKLLEEGREARGERPQGLDDVDSGKERLRSMDDDAGEGFDDDFHSQMSSIVKQLQAVH